MKMMPTAGRLFAALSFCAVAFFAAETYKPGLPEQQNWGTFSIICAVIGAIWGWRVSGRRAGRGIMAAMGTGMRTSATIVFVALLLFSVVEMLRLALRKRYDGVVSALEGVFEHVQVFGMALLRPDPLIVLVVGGIGGGLLAEWAARQWR